ncbi:hypothetical protein HDU81_005787 [Chytriomyces hyalinus]|nr:hypothetical protein HDU81_005787 [Chytriomyces hyalinus]
MSFEGTALPVAGVIAGCVVIAVAGVSIARYRQQQRPLSPIEEGASNAATGDKPFLLAQMGPESMPPPLTSIGVGSSAPVSAGPEIAGTPWSDAPTSATSITFSEQEHNSPLYSTMVSPISAVYPSPTSAGEASSMKRAKMLLGLMQH